MGSLNQAICKTCKHEFTFQTGGGFSYYQLLCTNCALTKIAPRKAPATDIEELSEKELAEYLGNSKLWQKNGSSFSKKENIIIQKLLSTCKCGGEMIPEWDARVRHRCPTCNGVHICARGGDLLSD